MDTREKIKYIMKKYDSRFKKSLGQNFLTDDETLENIAVKSGVNKDTCVIEIGPGIGVLTERLCKYAKKVVAIEIDAGLLPILSDTLSEYDNLKVINDDIMKVDITKLIIDEFGENSDVKIVANLPYYITTPIVMKLLEDTSGINSITVMVQKEVGQRYCAKSGNKQYGAITVSINYHCESEIILNVPKEYFIPSPKVDSCVIKLNVLKSPPVEIVDKKWFFKVVKGAFLHRRKTLLNSLAASGLGITKISATAALEKLELGINIRGETLDIAQFAKLAEILKNP